MNETTDRTEYVGYGGYAYDKSGLPTEFKSSIMNYWDEEDLREHLKDIRQNVYPIYKEISLPFIQSELVQDIVLRLNVLVLSEIPEGEALRNLAEIHAWQSLAEELRLGLKTEWDVVTVGLHVLAASEGMLFEDLMRSRLGYIEVRLMGSVLGDSPLAYIS